MKFSAQTRLPSRELSPRYWENHLLKEDQLKGIRTAVVNFITETKKDI